MLDTLITVCKIRSSILKHFIKILINWLFSLKFDCEISNFVLIYYVAANLIHRSMFKKNNKKKHFSFNLEQIHLLFQAGQADPVKSYRINTWSHPHHVNLARSGRAVSTGRVIFYPRSLKLQESRLISENTGQDKVSLSQVLIRTQKKSLWEQCPISGAMIFKVFPAIFHILYLCDYQFPRPCQPSEKSVIRGSKTASLFYPGVSRERRWLC